MISLKKRTRVKKKKRDKGSPDPVRVLIGTSPGTRQDAESLARSQIERYFDMADRSWLYIQKGEDDSGFHYEVHEGGNGRPLLPSLLEIERTPSEGVIIKPDSRHAIEVLTRQDQSLHSLVLPEKQSEAMVSDERLQPGKQKMKPYAPTGGEWVKMGMAALSIGLLTLTIAGVIHKSFSVAMGGYTEIAETLPTLRLVELTGQSRVPGDVLADAGMLPISQWERLTSQPLGPGESVSQMVFSDGEWGFKFETPKNPEETDATDTATGNDASDGMHDETADTGFDGGSKGSPHGTVSADPMKRDVTEARHEMSHFGSAQ